MLRILFAASLLATLVAAYFVFVRRERFDRRYAGVFGVALALSGVMAYGVWQEGHSPLVLSDYIDPFPGVEAQWVPPARGEGERSWVLRTVGSPEDVVRFYASAAHLRGWTIAQKTALDLYLKKGKDCLHIAMTPVVGEEGRTTILYTLREKCE